MYGVCAIAYLPGKPVQLPALQLSHVLFMSCKNTDIPHQLACCMSDAEHLLLAYTNCTHPAAHAIIITLGIRVCSTTMSCHASAAVAHESTTYHSTAFHTLHKLPLTHHSSAMCFCQLPCFLSHSMTAVLYNLDNASLCTVKPTMSDAHCSLIDHPGDQDGAFTCALSSGLCRSGTCCTAPGLQLPYCPAGLYGWGTMFCC